MEGASISYWRWGWRNR